MMAKLNQNQKAFTIIELLISTTVFSFVMLGASMMIIQISRLYYKGIVMTNTQTAARDLVESIARPIQYESAAVSSTAISPSPQSTGQICVGGARYSYQLKKQQTPTQQAIWKDDIPCGPTLLTLAGSPPSSGHAMLSNNMQIHSLVVEQVSNAPGLWKVEATVIYGDQDLLEVDPGTGETTGKCKGNVSGSQWCSAVSYKTMVFKRII